MVSSDFITKTIHFYFNMILTQHERQKKLMQENFLDTLKIVPSGVIIIKNNDNSIKFAN